MKLMEGRHYGPMNLGNPTEFTIRELADHIVELIKPGLTYIELPLPEDDPLQRKPIIKLAQDELDWNPRISLDEGLKKTIQDFKERLEVKSLKEPIIVTGAAGFIGAAVCSRLIADGEKVVGIDNINDYYNTALKRSRLSLIDGKGWTFKKLDISDNDLLVDIFDKYKPRQVIHLAAQAGVRYSIENPSAYIQSNLVGFGNILENCRNHKVNHLVYASSSSVYGGNTNMPFTESQSVNHPVSLYAATKKSNELMAHAYSHLYGMPAQDFVFSQSMDHGVDQIWLQCCLQKQY